MPNPAATRGLSGLRLRNRHRLVDVLRERGEVSRADLARLTQLSATTVSSLIAELNDEGVVAEVGRDDRGTGRTGRPGRLVQLVSDRGLVVGLDMGRELVRAAVCDLSGTTVAERTCVVDEDADGRDALRRTARLVNELVDDVDAGRRRILRVIAGVSGVVEVGTGHVVSDRVPHWRHVDPGPVLTEATGLPTSVENDADLGALAERGFGAARDLDEVFYVKASYGIGVGLVLGGRLYRGAHGGTGELGHVQVAERGDLCVCGNRGCLETVASLDPVLASLRVVHPGAQTANDLAALVSAGDRAAVRAVTDAGAVIGKAVADLCNLLAPQAVVVGGDLARGGPYVAGAVRDAVERYTKPRTAGRIAVLPSELDDRSAFLGAVAIAVEAEVTV